LTDAKDDEKVYWLNGDRFDCSKGGNRVSVSPVSRKNRIDPIATLRSIAETAEYVVTRKNSEAFAIIERNGRHEAKAVRSDGYTAVFQEYFKHKVSEGKTKPQALACVMRRLVNIIYGMLKNKSEYRAPEMPVKELSKAK